MSHPTVSEEDARILQPKAIVGSNIFSVDHVGRNLFHKAVITNQLDICKICIKYFDINCKTREGLTPICYTINGRVKDFNLIKFLLENGADVNSIGHRAEPAYQRIIGSNLSFKVVKLFHQYGLNTDGVLHFLCQKSHPPIGILKYFTIPALITSRDEYGRYPLAYAIEYLTYDKYIDDLCKYYSGEEIINMCYTGNILTNFERRLKLITRYGGSINTVINNKTIVHMLIDHTQEHLPRNATEDLVSIVPLLVGFDFGYQTVHRTPLIQLPNQTFLNYVIVNWLSKPLLYKAQFVDILNFSSSCMKHMTPFIINIPDCRKVPAYWHLMFFINKYLQQEHNMYVKAYGQGNLALQDENLILAVKQAQYRELPPVELIIKIVNQFYRYGAHIMQPMNGMFASDYLSSIHYEGNIVVRNTKLFEWVDKIRDAVKANEDKERAKARSIIREYFTFHPDSIISRKRCRAIQDEWDRSAKRIRSE
jgi:ankyrin repeat protein